LYTSASETWRSTARYCDLRDFAATPLELCQTFIVRGSHLSMRTIWKLEMAEKTLDDLFLDTLKDIYFAERQILKALPRMAHASQSPEGKEAFLKHKEQTEGQIERLQQVWELIGKSARGKTCEAIQGILPEGEEIMEGYKGSAALDAGLISSAQAVEHYEIARYGTLKSWAKQLGLTEIVPLIDANLQEEIQADEVLTQLGEASANSKASKKVA